MKYSLMIICIFMMLCACYIVYGDEIIYSQNFDNLKEGELAGQDGWDLITALSAAVGSPTIQGKVALKGKAVQIEAMQEGHIRWAKPVNTGTCYLSIFFRKENADAANTLHVYMGQGALAWSAGPVVRIGAQSGDPGQIGIHDGSDANIVRAAAFEVGKWHHLRKVIDVDKQSFDVYLDGKKLGNYKFRNAANHKTIDWLMIGFDAGVGLLGHFDAVEFGTGTGSGAFNRAASVDPGEKLSITWGGLKAN